MTAILNQADAWVVAALVLVALVIAWGAGLTRGAQRARSGQGVPDTKVADASLTLMGLLLGFTFAMALNKHDHRREMLVNDSNAIGDFYTCCTLLKEPVRSPLRKVVREYTEHRLNLARQAILESDVEQELPAVMAMQARMTELVGEAVDAGTPVTVPLVNTLNGLTSSHAARLQAARDRLPTSIVALLILATVISISELSYQQGATGKVERMPMLGFIVLVTFAMYITLDLNQPGRGLIQVSQAPLEQLLASMGK